MKASVVACVLFSIVQASNAWVVPKKALQKAVSIVSVSAAIFSSPLVSNASQNFSGYYDDPNHPNCVRYVKSIGQIATIQGTDSKSGDAACPANGDGNQWELLGKVTDDKIKIDFSPKGGPSDLVGVWEGGDSPGIKFPDGNKWTLQK